MKELKIEEKAKRYDEILVKLQKAKVDNNVCDERYCCVIDDIVPELKESEDEISKKWILEYLYDDLRKSDEQFKNQFKAAIAWLEKQSDKDKLIKELGEYKDKYTQEVLEKLIKGSFTYWTNARDFRPQHLQRCICYDKYMKGVYCYVYDDISKYWCTQTTEEHDPDGDNHICDYADYRVTMWMPLPDTSFYSSKSLCEKQDEQKPDDKVKPKFNVGDIIKHNKGNIICKVLSANVGLYRLVNILGGDEIELSNVEKNFHLWTIQDAKDGDILYAKGRYFKEYLFMVSSFTEDNVISTHFGYDVFRGTFDKKLTRFAREEELASVTPATKEQRDVLMKAMADAGYEWDADKKVLNKIEQKKPMVKPKFNIGDTMRTLDEASKNITNGLPVVVSIDNEYYHCNNELIAIKDQEDYEYPAMNRRQKPAWSEEDETALCDALWAIKQARSIAKDENDMGNLWYAEKWIKSLKDRVQTKTVAWKPSDKQMQELYNVFNDASSGWEDSVIESLYNDLKKLKD